MKAFGRADAPWWSFLSCLFSVSFRVFRGLTLPGLSAERRPLDAAVERLRLADAGGRVRGAAGQVEALQVSQVAAAEHAGGALRLDVHRLQVFQPHRHLDLLLRPGQLD